MEFITGKENPADWMSRHPEEIDNWTEEQRLKHNLDSGEEIRLNRVRAVRKLDDMLVDAGITGGDYCTEENIIQVGSEDEEYTKALNLVASGRNDKMEGV